MRRAAYLLVLFVLIAQLPLVGAWLQGLPLEPFHDVLPRLGRVRHAPLSWLAFGLLAALIAAVCAPFTWRLLRHSEPPALEPVPRATARMPLWGWAGLGLGALSWVVAWTRLPAFAPVQEHTFTPLWVAYVLVVNGLAEARTGTCALRRPRFWLLIPLSAVFWWFFEYVNRFVESWDYQGASFQNGWDVVLHGTLPFATVLPAVVSTQDLLATYPRLTEPFREAWRWSCAWPKAAAWGVVLTASAGLIGLSYAPNLLFPLPWTAPLFFLLAFAVLAGDRPRLLADVAGGDWRLAVTYALAALICGVCWEMWNSLSLARWTYSIPYVQALHVFEMPLLGYAGYLPFGLECAVVASLVGVSGHRRWEER